VQAVSVIGQQGVAKMLVMDSEKSEIGHQPRRAANGRRLHCCCICGKLDVWGSTWSTYCSVTEMDDCKPIPKFCSEWCQKAGGKESSNVTEEMKLRARDAEWREPEIIWREQTEREKYADAAYQQQKLRERASLSSVRVTTDDR
jgi:hypothetical protein